MVTDNQTAVGGLTEGTNLRAAIVPVVTDNQTAIGGLAEGTNLRAAIVPVVTDNQTAIGGLTEGTNVGVGRKGQANGSHDCQSDSSHSLLPTASSSTCGVDPNSIDAARPGSCIFTLSS